MFSDAGRFVNSLLDGLEFETARSSSALNFAPLNLVFVGLVIALRVQPRSVPVPDTRGDCAENSRHSWTPSPAEVGELLNIYFVCWPVR
jgi:hypothetical protein